MFICLYRQYNGHIIYKKDFNYICIVLIKISFFFLKREVRWKYVNMLRIRKSRRYLAFVILLVYFSICLKYFMIQTFQRHTSCHVN